MHFVFCNEASGLESRKTPQIILLIENVEKYTFQEMLTKEYDMMKKSFEFKF